MNQVRQPEPPQEAAEETRMPDESPETMAGVMMFPGLAFVQPARPPMGVQANIRIEQVYAPTANISSASSQTSDTRNVDPVHLDELVNSEHHRHMVHSQPAALEERDAPPSEEIDEPQQAASSVNGSAVSSVAGVSDDAGASPSGSGTSQEPIVVHDTDPPFLTDGRGRVVWSNASQARHRIARPASRHQQLPLAPPSQQQQSLQQQAQAKARAEPSPTSSRPPLPDVSRADASVDTRALSTVQLGGAPATENIEFVTDGRGRVIFTSAAVSRPPAQPALADDDDELGLFPGSGLLKARGDDDYEDEEDDDDGDDDDDNDNDSAGPSLLGRLWNAFFS